MLTEVADGVWVRQSAWVWTNSIVVRADGGGIVEPQGQAVGHAAVVLADRGALLAGDMLSDVLIPLLDHRRPDQVGAYETALDRLGDTARHVGVLVPGHGAVAEAPEIAARL